VYDNRLKHNSIKQGIEIDIKITMQALSIILSFSVMTAQLFSAVIYIPSSFASIQEGIDYASDGDTVQIAPGTYQEQLIISGKSIVLCSNYITTQDTEDISQTIVDGSNLDYVIKIDSTAGSETSIIGITVQNGHDGIQPYAHFNMLNNRIINCADGIDYESGSGGLCRSNTFENNTDDGIDIDDIVDVIIENNQIINNGDDGIEFRLHEYSGPLLNVRIQNNTIGWNDEDGIQLIDYPDTSNRIIHINNNLIINNAMVGIGCMADGITTENYEGASIIEPIYMISNTIVGNNYGITGGANLTAFNNIVSSSVVTAMKNVNGASLISYSAFWDNGQNFDNCIVDNQSLIFLNPLFISDSDYHIQDTSPCITAGRANGCPIRDLEYTQRGNPPDIGAYENISDGDQSLSVQLTIFTADFVDDTVILKWVTESELENMGFMLLRSSDKNGDYKLVSSFVDNHNLLGQGNKSMRTEYSYTEKCTFEQGTLWFKLADVSYGGVVTFHTPISIYIPDVKSDYVFSQNYPNPFNPITHIRYKLPEVSDMTLRIYDLKGRTVSIITEINQPPGWYEVEWDGITDSGDQVGTGVYFWRMESDDYTKTIKMMYLK